MLAAPRLASLGERTAAGARAARDSLAGCLVAALPGLAFAAGAVSLAAHEVDLAAGHETRHLGLVAGGAIAAAGVAASVAAGAVASGNAERRRALAALPALPALGAVIAGAALWLLPGG